MKIVQLLPDMQMGGVERGVVELSRALVRRGMDSVVVSRRGALSATIEQDGGRHIAFDCGGKNILTLPARARALRRLLRQLRPNIVHVRSRLPAWLLRFSGASGFARVSTFHGLYSVGAYSRQMAVADAVICPSNASRDYVRRHYRVAEEKLHLIHRGVDMDYFDPAKTQATTIDDCRRRHRLPQGVPIVAAIGRVSALKGHNLLLRAFARARRNMPPPSPVLLIVGGDGKRVQALRDTANALQLEDAVRFVPPQQQMREIYAVADVIVSASLKPEAFGRTMAEALAMRRPVVAAAHGGALDIVKNGENGLLFTPGDERQLAVMLREVLQREWRGLRESVEAFSLSQMTDKTIAVYRAIANA